jgi:hypothetical protein
MPEKFMEIRIHKSVNRSIFYRDTKSLSLEPEFSGRPFFSLFLSVDSTSLGDDELYGFAYHAVKAGLTHSCLYGPGSERLKDILDEVTGTIQASDHIRTNEKWIIEAFSPSGETIENAVRCFLKSAFSEGDSENRPVYVMNVGVNKQGKEIKKIFKRLLKGL